jgi:hypothetical protein
MATTAHSTSHGTSPSFGTVIRIRLRAAESRSRPARVRMITRATFLLTDITFRMIASRGNEEINTDESSQPSCKFVS